MALELWLVLLGHCRKQALEQAGCRRQEVVEEELPGEVVALLRERGQELEDDKAELVAEGCKPVAAEVLLGLVLLVRQEDLQQHNHQGNNAGHNELYC